MAHRHVGFHKENKIWSILNNMTKLHCYDRNDNGIMLNKKNIMRSPKLQSFEFVSNEIGRNVNK